MNKVILIIKREYFSRVKKKSFLLMTFLVPVLFLGMWAGVIFLSIQDADTLTTVNVLDKSGLFGTSLENSGSIHYNMVAGPVEQEKGNISRANNKNSYLLIIPEDVREHPKVELF